MKLNHVSFTETSSPDDLEEHSNREAGELELAAADGGMPLAATEENEEKLNEGAEVDNVERIFVPEHKNQATSPSYPMAQSEEFVAATASDGEVNGDCLMKKKKGEGG